MSDTNNKVNISFRFGGRELNADGTGRVTVRLVKSRYVPVETSGVAIHGPSTTNELLHLIHALRKTRYADAAQQAGFTYTFGFKFGMGYGFPYTFTFKFGI